jgi:polysaccharide pyruvyl transferase WcaK-like protein
MKSKIKVLHLASFLGNIGDFANHQGFYKKFQEHIPAEFTQLEIRKFYKNRSEMKFDDSFLELIHTHDLLVLGGGGFFDLKWDYSSTGTTIDLSEKFIQDIKIPVLVNGMGYHEYEEVKEENVAKFKNFLKIITDNKNWFISVRNDGSFGRMKARYGSLVDKVLKVPDHGFFFSPKEYSRFGLEDKNTVWIGLNLTNDLFNECFNKGLGTEEFNQLMGKFINRILQENSRYKIILFPHAHQDISTTAAVIGAVEDKYKRERIVVAPLITVEASIEQVFDLYRICSLIIGMRFHTNVCSIAMNIPTIGLAGHEQISALYNELGIQERCIKLDTTQFIDRLEALLKDGLPASDQVKKAYQKVNLLLDKEVENYYKKLDEWMKK